MLTGYDMPLRTITILVLGSFCAAFGTVLLKLGATGRAGVLAFINPKIVLGLGLYGVGAVFWIYGMSRQNLINVYPFTILSFTMVYLVGIFGLGERPSRLGFVGVALILAGLYLVARKAS